MSNGTINTDSERRMAGILRSVRRELGLRDVFTFGASTIWSVLYVMGVTGTSMLNDLSRSTDGNEVGAESNAKDSDEQQDE